MAGDKQEPVDHEALAVTLAFNGLKPEQQLEVYRAIRARFETTWLAYHRHLADGTLREVG